MQCREFSEREVFSFEIQHTVQRRAAHSARSEAETPGIPQNEREAENEYGFHCVDDERRKTQRGRCKSAESMYRTVVQKTHISHTAIPGETKRSSHRNGPSVTRLMKMPADSLKAATPVRGSEAPGRGNDESVE